MLGVGNINVGTQMGINAQNDVVTKNIKVDTDKINDICRNAVKNLETEGLNRKERLLGDDLALQSIEKSVHKAIENCGLDHTGGASHAGIVSILADNDDIKFLRLPN